jgi:hypothetical protein
MDNNILVRPFFRVLYGIVSFIGVVGIFIVIYFASEMWNYNIFRTWRLTDWCIMVVKFIYFLAIGICFAYTGFIIAKSGKPPKYLIKYFEKYNRRYDDKW